MSGDVELKLPGATQQPLTGEGTKRDGLEGETAAFYGFTRGVTVLVNTGVAATLTLVEKIVEYPPTTTTPTSATWGPHTEALSPNTWKMTVTLVEKDVYSYSLVGKGKSEPDSAFRTELLNQAAAYRKLAAKRAEQYGLPAPSPPKIFNSSVE